LGNVAALRLAYPKMADEFMARLKAGSTVRKLTLGGKKFGPAIVTYSRFKKHCKLYPEWKAEALPQIESEIREECSLPHSPQYPKNRNPGSIDAQQSGL
jgi:hypothetical protein